MCFKVKYRVKLKNDGALPKGSSGTVITVWKNGNLKVRMTHDPSCVKLDQPFTIPSIPPGDLEPSDCADNGDSAG